MKRLFIFLFSLQLLLAPMFLRAEIVSTTEHFVTPAPVIKRGVVLSKTTNKLILKKGDIGQSVCDLQAWLLNNGFSINSIDCVYGKETTKAVRSLQKIAQLKEDGVFGPNTALFVSIVPLDFWLNNSDKTKLDSLRQQFVVQKSVVGKLPKGVSDILADSLPKTSVLKEIAVSAPGYNEQLPNLKLLATKKPKLVSMLKKATYSIVTSANYNQSGVLESKNIFTNNKEGSAEQTANSIYVCAKVEGDNICQIISEQTAKDIEEGRLDAIDELAGILGRDTDVCTTSTRDPNGNLTIIISPDNCSENTSSGDVGSKPEGIQITGSPKCIPQASLLEGHITGGFLTSGLLTGYLGYKDPRGNEQLDLMFRDMDLNDKYSHEFSNFGSGTFIYQLPMQPLGQPTAIYIAVVPSTFTKHGLIGAFNVQELNPYFDVVKFFKTGSPDFEVMKTSLPPPKHPNNFNNTELLEQIKNGKWHLARDIGQADGSPWNQTYLTTTKNGELRPPIEQALASARWIHESSTAQDTYEIYRVRVCANTPR